MDLRATLRVKYISLANERTRFVTILSTKLVNEDQLLFDESGKLHPLVFFQNQIGREKLIKSEFLKEDQQGTNENLESVDRKTRKDSDRKHDSLWTYYITLWYSHSRRTQDLKLLLFLQIIFLEVSILRISYTLNTLKKSLGSEFHRCFDIFLFEAILAARLQTKAKGDNLQSSDSILLSDLLQDISHEGSRDLDSSPEGDTSSENLRSTSLDRNNSYARYMRGYGKKSKRINLELGSILDFKNKYLTCLAQISRVLGTKLELYSCLFDTSSLKSLFVYQKVSSAYDLALEIDRYLINMCMAPKVPTYILASSISYFLKVRFDVNKSELLFKQYRAKILRFQTLAGLKLQEISHGNFDYNSVTLRVSVALDSTLGQIEDISTNYQEHLGEAGGGDPTKLSVNGLFPGQMAEGHLQMMRGLSNQDIFNTQRGFQLNGFDGHLRPVTFVLKIDASISNGIHSLALLRFPNHQRVQLLLVDDQLRVLSSDKRLLKILMALGMETSPAHVAQLSEGLAAQIHLHKFLTQLQSNGLRSNSGKIGQSSGRLQTSSSVAALAELAAPDTNIEEELAKEFAFNRTRQRVLDSYVELVRDGVQHRLNQPGLGSSQAELPLVTTIEESWFGEDRFYRIWCSFDFGANEASRRLLAEHEIEDANSQGALHVVVGDGMRISRSKGSDTGSKQGKLGAQFEGAQQNSLKSDQFGTRVDYSKGNLKPFVSILQTLNTATPFEGLMIEAKNRSSDPEQKEAYDWMIQICTSLPNNALPKVVWTTTQLAPGTPVTPIIARQIGQDSNAMLEQPAYNFSDAAQEVVVKGPKPTVSAHEQLRKMLKETATLGFQHTTSLAADLKPSNIQSSDAIAMMVPVETTNIDQNAASQIVQSKSTNKFDEEPEKDAKWGKKNSKDRDRLSREFSYRGGNADSTTALVAKESKESTIEEKEIKITKIQLQIGERGQDINRVHPAAKSLSGGASGSPMTTQEFGLAKTYKTAGASLKSKLTGKSKVFKETRTYSGKEVAKKRTIWNLSHLSRVFQKPEKNLNTLRKKEQVTSTYITTVSRGEAFVSHSQLNLQLMSRYIAEYKGIRKLDVAPEDKNHSITASTKSNSSKGAYLFKLVHNALAAKRKDSVVYFFTAGLACLTLFFALAFQVTISGLQNYNRTNQDSFLLVTKFITFERRLIEAVEFQESLYEHSYAAWVPSLWSAYRTGMNSSLPPPMNSSMYLLNQFSGIVDDITQSLQDIVEYTNSLGSRKDAGNINGVVFQTQNLNYWERRYQTGRNLSTPYSTWDMPYFSIIAYFAEILAENQVIFKRILERGLITNVTLVPNDPDLLLVQKIKYGFTATVANGMLNNLDELFQQMTRSIVLETVDQHFTPVFGLIYACIAISVLMAALSYYAYQKTNEMHRQHLESFSFLKSWEVAISIEDNEHLENLFTKYAFHEVQLINEYLDLGLYSTVAQFNSRILKLEQKLSKDKDKSGGYKFAHNFSFLTSKLYFVFVALNLVIFAMLYVTVAAFLSTNDNRIGVQQIMYNAHSKLIKVKKFYLTPFLMLIYGYSVNIGSKNLAENPYNKTYDEFLQFLTQSRTEYINYFDAEDLDMIEDISFGDICGRGREFLQQNLNGVAYDFYPRCITVNNASATRGIFGFLQYDQNILERVRNYAVENYAAWLTNSTRTVPARPQTGLLFINTVSQERTGHKTVLDLYYRLLEALTVKNIGKITARLQLVINQILQTVAVGYFLAVLAGYVLFLFLQAREIDRCYEAYKLIDPYFLMSNRYLQHRFKSAFQGHE